MLIRILPVGIRKPNVDQLDYLKRITRWRCEIVTPCKTHSKYLTSSSSSSSSSSGSSRVTVALDETGTTMSSAQFAAQFESFERDSRLRNVDLFVGDANGFESDTLARCQLRWSLSALTLPHQLAALVLVEQIYRAQTLLEGHPYHR
jgi:23S rRNA (pseudouridine1915-N3)-methyltransferase